ncbi:hypothetical protein GCM10028801_39070 [Nocardioides maradonensis]
MAEGATGYSDVAMRVGIFCRPDGFNAVSTGWPFGSLTYGQVGVAVSAPGIVSAAVRRRFAWADVVHAERTSHGVRFRFGDRASTIVVTTLSGRNRRLLAEAARQHCVEGVYSDEVHRLHWWRWDPDE